MSEFSTMDQNRKYMVPKSKRLNQLPSQTRPYTSSMKGILRHGINTTIEVVICSGSKLPLEVILGPLLKLKYQQQF
jgi:hypothetical protein